jgi:phenylacetate-CoA ligase
MDWRVQSDLPGLAWPAIPSPEGAAVLALLYQLQHSQWLPAQRLAALQMRQLSAVLQHAHRYVPYYRGRWGAGFDVAASASPEGLAALPLLTRRELLENHDALKSERIPPEHGNVVEARTSGSTGAPVRVLGTGIMNLHWKALTLREHGWHQRDLSRKLAVIRRATPGVAESWGAATAGTVLTGASVSRDIDADVEAQLDWLARERPTYLLTYPSLVVELAKASLRRGEILVGLREVRTLAEALGADARALCREAWGVPLTDFYSAGEVGYIALQCPQHEHYHVQSESLLVEILDDRGLPCGPGEVGRVVVTALHNFAMPLIRYEIGDYAATGAPCPCGRGLPVLEGIVGRVNGMLVTASGERYWPVFGMRDAQSFANIRQHQFVQKQFDLIQARLVVDAPLSATQEERLRRHMEARLPAGIRVQIVYCDAIPRSPGGKFQDFISEVPHA